MTRRTFLGRVLGALAAFLGGGGLLASLLRGLAPSPRPLYDAQDMDDEVIIPVVELVSNPTIRLADIKERRFYISKTGE